MSDERHPIHYHWNGDRGQWIAESPLLPGFTYAADSVEDLNSQVREAMAEWVDTCRERGQRVPEHSVRTVDLHMIEAAGPLQFGDALPEIEDEAPGQPTEYPAV